MFKRKKYRIFAGKEYLAQGGVFYGLKIFLTVVKFWRIKYNEKNERWLKAKRGVGYAV